MPGMKRYKISIFLKKNQKVNQFYVYLRMILK